MKKKAAILRAKLALRETENSIQEHLVGSANNKMVILDISTLRTLIEIAEE